MARVPAALFARRLVLAACVLADRLWVALAQAGGSAKSVVRRESQRASEAAAYSSGFSRHVARPGRAYANLMQRLAVAPGVSVAAVQRRRDNTSFSYVGIGRPKKDNAIVTLICSQQWMPGALALAASLRKHGSKADLVLLMSKDVPRSYHSILAENFDVVRVEPPITPHPSITRAGGDCVSRQLHTWRLPYKKALYMDADMIVLKNPDSLFAHSQLTAKVDNDTSDEQLGFNGGMFVCEPGTETFNKLVRNLQTWEQNTTRRGMQQFLNHMFPQCGSSLAGTQQAGCWQRNLSHQHNKYTRELSFKDATALISGEHVYDSLHFSGDWEGEKKPWMKGCLMPSSSTSKVQGYTHEDVLDLWMSAYSSVRVPAATVGLPKIECPFFDCVAPQKQLDFFVYTTSLDCVLRDALNRLMLHASPRRLFVIGSGAFCKQFQMDGVKCLDRDGMLAGLSYPVVEQFIRHQVSTWTNSPINWDEEEVKKAIDKYFGQLLKLGIARKSEELGISEHYVILDPEVVLIRNFCPFNRKGQTNFMESVDRSDQSECSRIQASVFDLMSGLSLARSHMSHAGFASHHAVVNTDSMKRFLDILETHYVNRVNNSRTPVNGSLPMTWASAILESACGTSLSCSCGFSEYDAYASWMKHERPHKFAELPALYRRMAPMNWSRPAPCCPASYDLSGDEGLGMGHQFVHFARDCSLPKKTTREENQFWFHKTMSAGKQSRPPRSAQLKQRKRVRRQPGSSR
mmetsp:Transcript_95299/g.168802  ORF Transcript_95299/g.168802 Transcript_95299/m.168802 type:complete len:744 (+) Transcript_95299:57-2288(+)